MKDVYWETKSNSAWILLNGLTCEWVSDCSFQEDDDDVCFVLDQHA
jgi:hypothetical protein